MRNYRLAARAVWRDETGLDWLLEVHDMRGTEQRTQAQVDNVRVGWSVGLAPAALLILYPNV